MSDPDGAPQMSEQDEQRPLIGKKVLIVEDEMLIAFDLMDTFGDAGAAAIGPAGTLEQAFETFDKDETDVAILDIDLRGVSVFPFAEALVKRNIPIVFHSGHGTLENLETRFPGAAICPKPASKEELINKVSSLLATES